ncbi:hypothetical protein LOAG_15907 [Loa loa]|uniref:Uncharacterized protein n=1 Tax=Loa loa TaxID=7209 RepID=A0A1S0TEQ0_LOALO|nr:hypothetical protein LOAG_15907 [Loa loa]EFO12627.1 hypothetical protein LOAG_15907 [Loa loa]
MLFTCSGSANVKNQRVVVFGQEHLPKRSNSSFDEQRSELQSGRNSQGSASCPETFRTYASSPTRDSPYFRSRSNSRSSSRTEILQPGQWTTVTSQVKFRALTPTEQQEVFEKQKRERLLREESGE